jgi:hypothetical protein
VNLDQIARDAAGEANDAARTMPITPIEGLRTRRVARILAPIATVGIVVWIATLLLGSPTPDTVPPAGTTPTTIDSAPTTVPETSTTVADKPVAIDAAWVRGTSTEIVDDRGNVLHEYPSTILFGRNTAWDGEDGFVALTDAGLIWMRPDEETTVEAPFGSIIDAVVTEDGTHVVGVENYEDEVVHWIELETGAEVAPPSNTKTLDGVTFTVGNREVTIEPPDWSDAERDETGAPLPPYDLPTLIVSEDGVEVFRMEVGTEQRPFVDIHDFDGRRLIFGAQPFEPAVPPATVWIVDLECPDCTEKVETESLEYFDLIGVLPSEGSPAQPNLP